VPGTSTGPLKVTTVSRFNSSADTVGTTSMQNASKQNTAAGVLNDFMFFSSIFLRLGRTAVVLQELFMLSVSQEIYSRKIRKYNGRRD
jgi:hypothetical protein